MASNTRSRFRSTAELFVWWMLAIHAIVCINNFIIPILVASVLVAVHASPPGPSSSVALAVAAPQRGRYECNFTRGCRYVARPGFLPRFAPHRGAAQRGLECARPPARRGFLHQGLGAARRGAHRRCGVLWRDGRRPPCVVVARVGWAP